MADQLNQKLDTITQQSAERDAILENMAEGVIAVDREGKIIFINSAVRRWLQIPETLGRGSPVGEAIRIPDLQALLQGPPQPPPMQSTPSVVEEEITLLGPPPQIFQAHATAFYDPEGAHMGYLVVLNDLTQIKRLEKMRRDFVANVSHELKTPLTAIGGFLETLQSSELGTEERDRFYGIISRQSSRLNAIVDDLLLLSRIEADGGQIPKNQVSLDAILRSALELSRASAERKKIRVHLDSEGELEAFINPSLMEQAITNLVQNAIKYSPEGTEVVVKARQEQDEIILSVRDQGPGIGSQHLERIFERFYRIDKGRSRQEGGTGLGLAIVKHIAQVHGGHASAQSRMGHGSDFQIRFPDGKVSNVTS